MRNILFVVDERRIGGVSILLEDMMNNLKRDKYNIDILVLHNNGESLSNLPKDINLIYGTKYFSSIDLTLGEALKSKNIMTIYHKIRVVFDMKTGLIKRSIIKERKKILKKQYDVEIAFKDGFTALFTIFGDAKRKIHWLHYEYKKTNPNGKYDKLFKKILPLFDNIIAVSDGVAKAFKDIYHIDKVDVIENFVDTKKIIAKSKEQGLKVNKKDLNFISVGRLHNQKGYDRLIKVVGQLLKEGKLPSNLKIRIYGDGPLKDYLANLISEYHVSDIIYLMGKTSNPYKEIKNASLFLLPSYYEPFGIVIVEAMVLKVPVLAASNAITNKLINNKVNGLVVPNSDEEYKKGLLYLINNLDELKKYKDNLHDYSYNNSIILKRLEEELDK